MINIADLLRLSVARFKKDAMGILGLLGPDGRVRKLGQAKQATMLICADSITAFSEANIAAVSVVNNGDGTATVTMQNPHLVNVGQPIRVNVAANQALNVMDSYVTAIVSPTVFKIKLGGRTHKVTGANGVVPNIVFPWRRGSRGWVRWYEGKAGMSFRITWCAVGGATSAQIYDLLMATPMTELVDHGVVFTGMNDFYSANLNFAQAQADVKKLIDEVRSRSNITTLVATPPRNSADPNWSAAKQAIHTGINRWMHLYAQQTGCLFFDTTSATQNGLTYVNPAATYPDGRPEFMYDNTHPSARGAQAFGYGLYDLHSAYLGARAWKPVHKSQLSVDTGNILVNGELAAGANGVASTFAMLNVTAGANVVTTVEARTVAADGDVCGNNQVIKANYGTATGLAVFSFRRNGIHNLLPVGKTVQWRILTSVANAIGLLALEMTIYGTLSDGSVWQVYSEGLDGNVDPVPGAYTDTLMTPPAVVPAGLTSCDIWIRGVMDSTQTTDAVIKYAQNELLPYLV